MKVMCILVGLLQKIRTNRIPRTCHVIAMTSQESAFDPWPSSNHSLSSEEDSDLKQVNYAITAGSTCIRVT